MADAWVDHLGEASLRSSSSVVVCSPPPQLKGLRTCFGAMLGGCWIREGDDRGVSPLAGYIDLLVGVGMQTIRARRQKGWQGRMGEREKERKEES